MRWIAPGAAAFLLAILLTAVLGGRDPLGARREPEETPTAPHTIRIARIEQSPASRGEPESPAPALPRAGAPEPPNPPTRSADDAWNEERLQSGHRWLASGEFPELRATYRRIGFPAYRDAMQALGARFFLYDVSRRRLMAEVDPASGQRLPGASRSGLSAWPRDVTRHMSRAIDSEASRVVLLPPVELDAALLGSVDTHLRAHMLDPSGVRRLDLAYELQAGRLGCEVLAAAFADGSERTLSLRVDLSPPRGGEHA